MTVNDAPEVVLVMLPTCVLIVDIPLLPAITVSIPAVIAELPLVEAVIVLLPETVKEILPLAVTLYGMLMLPLVEVSDNAPDEAPPTAKTLESVMLPEDVMLRVLMVVAEPMVKVEPPCPTVIVSLDSPRVTRLLPRLSVIGPVLLMLPLTVLLPETASIIPPFAVRLYGTFMLPLVEVSDNPPDDAPPTEKTLESIMLPDVVMLREPRFVAEPMVKVEPPCTIVMVSSDCPKVTALLPSLSVTGPVLLILPLTVLLPKTDRVRLPFAVRL